MSKNILRSPTDSPLHSMAIIPYNRTKEKYAN